MTDRQKNVVEFPERRVSIPVNLPDIGVAEVVQCGCGGRLFSVMMRPKVFVEIICHDCGLRIEVAHEGKVT